MMVTYHDRMINWPLAAGLAEHGQVKLSDAL